MKNWNSLVVSLWCGKYEFASDKEVKIYRTFGNHDSISIAPISGNTSTELLKGMWEKTSFYSHDIKAGESIHNLFAIANDDYKLFWENEMPYLFMSSIQLNYNETEKFEDQFEFFKIELSKVLEENSFEKNSSYAIYNSLDSSDFILFLKTNNYLDGANIIHKIPLESSYHHYSYSVCGLNEDLILKNLEENNEIIPKVVICSVLEDFSQYKNWFNRFCKEYPYELKQNIFSDDLYENKNECEEYVHLARLGNEDICINIYNCNLKHFFKMFFMKDGVFYHGDEYVKFTFARLRIQFDSTIGDIKTKLVAPYKEGTSFIAAHSKIWKNELKHWVNPYISKAIFEVLAATENLELKKFAFDVQDCIRNVLPLFTSKVSEYNKSYFGYSKKEFENDVILFTTGLLSIANGSLHADKLFINVPGFNAVPCDIPSKLLVYYTAYIQKLSKILNDNKEYEYRFLLCPDLYLGIEIYPLFYYCSSDSQLLKARIPIKKLFDSKILLMELSHEVAHYVGVDIRSREERKDLICEMIAYVFADRLLRPKKFECGVEEDDYSDVDLELKVIKSFMPDSNNSIEKLLANEWNGIIDSIKNRLIVDDDFSNDDILYLAEIKKKITQNSLNLLIGDEFKSLINDIFSTIKSSGSNNSPDEIFLLANILEHHKNGILLNEYKSIIKNCCTLFSESFADLVMLYIIEDPSTYLYNIFISETAEKYSNGNDDVYTWEYMQAGHMNYERIIAVFKTLNYSFDEIDTNDNLLYEQYIKSIKFYYDECNETQRANPINVIDIISNYLTICLSKLSEKKSEFEMIKDLYDTTKNEDINMFLDQFRKIAFEFRTKLINLNDSNDN